MHTHTQPPDPCPSFPVTNYTINITERDTNTLTTSIRYYMDSDNRTPLTVTVDSEDGLVPYQVYTLVIEAENIVGSSISEDFYVCKLLHSVLIFAFCNVSFLHYYDQYADTTGLQSVRAVMELDGSITVTCTFATGASSTGCLVTIFTTDNSQLMVILSKNITRQNGNTEVNSNILVLPESTA